MIKAIVAIADNFAIGKAGRLPWHHSADLKFFKQTTLGHAVLMGSTTWRSIGRPLPGRVNVVMTRSAGLDLPDGVVRVSDRDAAIEFARGYDGDTFVIGGAKTYESLADMIDEWIVTHVPDEAADADTFLPKHLLDGFSPTHEIDLDENLRVSFMRRRP